MGLVPYRRSNYLDQALGNIFKGFFDDYSELPSTLQDWNPQIDLFEEGDKYLVKLELPGINEKDIEITLENNILTISGSKQDDREEKTDGYHYTERSFGKFQRRIRLPGSSDPDKVTANLNQGILEVTVEKADVSKPKSIPINPS